MPLSDYYNYRAKTAEERIKPMMLKGKMEKDDVAGIIDMLADMRAIFHEARMDGMDTHLDRGDVIRQIVMGKIPFASEEFYKKESKKEKKDPGFLNVLQRYHKEPQRKSGDTESPRKKCSNLIGKSKSQRSNDASPRRKNTHE